MPRSSQYRLPICSKGTKSPSWSSRQGSQRSSASSSSASRRRFSSSRSTSTPTTSAAPSNALRSSRRAAESLTSSGGLSHNYGPARLNPDDDMLDEVIMVVDLQHRDTVGCSYYVTIDEKMYFMEDVQFGGVDIVDALRVYIDPTTIIISTKTDDAVRGKLDPYSRSEAASQSEDNDQYRLPFLIEVRPPSEFLYESAKKKLASLKLDDIHRPQRDFVVPGDTALDEPTYDEEAAGQVGRMLYLSGIIDMDSRLTIGCAGALVSYLQRRRAAIYLPGDPNAHQVFRISKLEVFSLRDTMFINADTLHSLQILRNESHPNSHNQGPTKANSGTKEGLSVYNLFYHLARTSQGRYRLRQLFLRPSLNADVINERLDTIRTLLHPENTIIMDELVKCLKGVGNARVMMANLEKGSSASPGKRSGPSKNVWIALQRFTFNTIAIKNAVCNLRGGQHLAIVAKIVQRFEGRHLANVGVKISETIDLETSVEESRTIIMAGVDEELDNMKELWAGLDDLLQKVARKLSEEVPATVQGTLNVIYFPQIGFLVTVPIDPLTGEAVYLGNFENPWEQIFSTDGQVYFKNDEVREMDSHFGDVFGLIVDREIEISHELSRHILEYKETFIETSDICGELDSLVALSQGAKNYNLVRPRISEDNVIDIKGGRHILQERALESGFVPNKTMIVGGPGEGPGEEDAHSQASGPSMLILTGPNYSGKSVYLKQVALITYMAHVGCYVPAERAKIGITDKILSRVSTRETVSRNQSAFMIDLQQISLALNLATRKSLLIIDEFGKGTDSSDGAGLACAVFKYLLGLGAERSKVLVATHFHEIFENGLLRPSPSVAFGYMEVRVDEDKSEVEEQITYLYNFCDGQSNSSFGTCCAAMNGVPQEVIVRADELILMTMRGEDLVAACSIMPSNEEAELEEAEQIARRFVEVEFFEDPGGVISDILSVSGSTDFHS